MTRPSQPHAQPKAHEDQRQPLANTKTVEEARAALAAHDATCPGDHFQCCGDPEKAKARKKWVDDRGPLLFDLELAEKTHAATWRSLPIEKLEPHMPAKKTAQEKLNAMLTRLDRLIAEGKGRLASTLRWQIRDHCEFHKMPVPAMPVNPNPTPGIIQKAQPKASPKVTTLEEVLQPKPGGEAVACAQLERVLRLPEGSVSGAAEAATYRPDMPPEVREIIVAGAQDALARRAQRMLGDAAQLLKEATTADAAARAEATRVLGNLDGLVHMVHIYVVEGRIEVGA